ncbi:response regulator [Halomicrobium urmianum]|uniref:response regulator n=1 Tax=Halomicrobium urmianum TaxID=1586233 RepID=UPI001CDA3661|nr:response regulator [Halomicrobium urmianum]
MADTAEAECDRSARPTTIRVLQVDDDEALASTVAEFLERINGRITTISESTAPDALSRLESTDVDCVVTDYQMPRMDGIEFIEAVREEYPDLPCILYTGEGSEAVASDAIAAGATDYLRKRPETKQYELLANRIENAVESYRARRRARTLERARAVAREVNRALLRASTGPEIERAVCDVLADSTVYLGAWIGTVDPESGAVEPRCSAGVDAGPDRFVAAGEWIADRTGDGTAGAALGDGRVAVREAPFEGGEANEVSRASSERSSDGGAASEASRSTSERRSDGDVRSVATVPLSTGDECRGLLTVYSGQQTVTAAERDLLAELADDVTHALGAVETRQALRAERDRRAALFENAPVPVAEAHYREDGVAITDVNAAFVETFGFGADDIEADAVVDHVVPEGEREGHEAVVAALTDGESVVREVRRRTADDVRDFLLTACPVSNGDGDGAYVWYTDVTERRELEAALRERANLLDHIFGQIPTALYVKDTEGRHVRMSDYDTDPTDAIGKTDPEIYGDTEFAQEAYADDMRVIEEGERIHNREEYNPENGEWTLTSKVPYYGEDGEIKGLIGVSRLITEKKEYERELKRKNERLEEFASVISHDLRNPLTVALGQLDHYRAEHDDERLDRTGEALERMETLIEDLLALARQGQSIDQTRSVRLSDAVADAQDSVEAPDATVDVTDDGEIEANESRLRQLLENLFRNASEHAGESASIRVGALEDGFFVADDGPGIDPDERERIFEPGYTTNEGGTGLGLAIVCDVAEAHGWDVTVTESDAGGARFEFTGVSANAVSRGSEDE